MKIFVAFLFVFFLFSISHAAPKSKKGKPKNTLSTNVNFDDRLVGGKYQYSTEAITKVENDKSLDDLIGVRKNFKDRIVRSETLR